MLPLGLSFALTSMVAAAAWPNVSSEVAPFALGADDAAVIAGVSQPFVLPEVKGAVENATDWFTWLTKARGVPLERVHLLRDGEVTRERMLAAAAQAASQVGPKGTLWIVFVGHGAPSASGDDGLLLGVDAQRTELSLRERGLPQRELLAAAKGAQATTLAVFDACFSGMASDGKTPLVEGSQATLPIRRDASEPGLLVLSSSEEVAGPLPGHDRPAFSYLLLGALRGWADANGDARVTVAEAYGYSRQTLINVVRDKNQSPTLRGAGVDTVVAEKAAERGPDIVQLVAAGRAPVAPPAVAASDTRSAAEVARLEKAFERRAIKHDPEKGVWRRGDFPTPLSRNDLIFAGKAGAPQAAKTLEELELQESMSTLVWTIPPVAGLVVGAGVGVGVGAFLAAQSADSSDQTRAFMLGSFIGGFGGASAGAMLVSLPLGLWAQIDPQEKLMRENAEAELANVANIEERKKLGLSP